MKWIEFLKRPFNILNFDAWIVILNCYENPNQIKKHLMLVDV